MKRDEMNEIAIKDWLFTETSVNIFGGLEKQSHRFCFILSHLCTSRDGKPPYYININIKLRKKDI